jgi:hypothetical protein
MKTTKLIAILASVAIGSLLAHAQGTFQNLDFESVNLTPVPPQVWPQTFVPISSALPGWNASIGGDAVTEILQNGYDSGTASVDILGPNWTAIEPGIIDGHYTVFLQSGFSPQNNSIGVNTSIWQNGTIPANAQSLHFSAWNWNSGSPFTVSFNGNDLSLVALYLAQTAAGQTNTVYEANIAPYAGQTGQLEFTSVFTYAGASWTEFDDITFLTVPEPGILTMTVVGGLLFSARKWIAQHR